MKYNIPVEPPAPGDMVTVKRRGTWREAPPPIPMPPPTLLHRRPPVEDAMEVDPVDPIVGDVWKFGEIDAKGDREVDKPSTSKLALNLLVGRKRPVATGRLYKPPCEKCQKDNQDCEVATGGGSCISCWWKKIRCMYGAK